MAKHASEASILALKPRVGITRNAKDFCPPFFQSKSVESWGKWRFRHPTNQLSAALKTDSLNLQGHNETGDSIEFSLNRTDIKVIQ